MKIQVKYFASLRASLGVSEETLSFEQPALPVGFIRDHLIARGGAYAEQLSDDKSLRIAVNFQLADDESLVDDGAELAFFPPVTGG